MFRLRLIGLVILVLGICSLAGFGESSDAASGASKSSGAASSVAKQPRGATFELRGRALSVSQAATVDRLSGMPGSGEVVALRTRTSRTFVASPGHLRTVIYAAPINYETAVGAWQPIDDTLVPSSRVGYAWVNRADAFQAFFPSDLATAPVRVERGGRWIAFRLKGATEAAQVSRNHVVYRGAFPGVTVSYSVTSEGVRQTIALANRSAALQPLETALHTSSGVTRHFVGQAATFSAAGRPVFSYQPGRVTDASGVASTGATLQPEAASAGTVAGDVLSRRWVSSAKRRWPLKVVSLTTTGTLNPPSGLACYMTELSATQKFCTGSPSQVRIGWDSSFHARRGLLYFDISNLPQPGISDAVLNMYCFNANTTNSVTLNVRRATSKTWTTDVTWNKSDASTNWGSPGGDFNTTDFGGHPFTSCPTHSYKQWPDTGSASTTALVNYWTSHPGSNYGILIKEDSEGSSSNNYYDFKPAGDTNQPYLSVTTYDGPSGTITTSSTSSNWSINTSATVSASGWTADSGRTISSCQYRTSGLTGPWSAAAAATWSSGTDTCTSPAITSEGTTYVQFQAIDDLGDSSDWQPATTSSSDRIELDRTAPTAPSLTGGGTTWQSVASVNVSASGSGDGDGSGVSYYQYETSTDNGTTWSGPTTGTTATITAEGQTLVQFQAVDALSHASSWTQATVRIDRTAPTAPSLSGGGTGWQNTSSVSVTASGSTDSGGSGLVGYQYQTSTDGGTTWSVPATSGSSATITSEGETLVKFQAVDGAGNTTSSQTTVQIDRTAPSTPDATGGSSSWQNAASVKVTPTGASDAGSGVVSYMVRTSTDGGTTWSAGTSTTAADGITVTAEGQTLVEFQAVDGTGQTSGWGPATVDSGSTVRLNRTAPSVPTVSGGSLSWQSVASVMISASGSTASNGDSVAGYQYQTSTDGGTTWSTSTSGSSDIVTAEGETLVRFRAVDTAGNTSAWAPTTNGAGNTARLNRTAPTAPTVSGGSLSWQSVASVTISASGSTASNGDSIGGYQCEASTDGGATWSTSTSGASETVTAEGETLLRFRAVDTAGNTSTWAPATNGAGNTARIDLTAPSAPTVSGGSLSWQDVSEIDIAASGSTDAESGVGRYEYETSTDGGTTWSATPTTGSPAAITAEGETLVRFRAVDGAGNASDWAPTTPDADSTARIDRGGPTITSSTDPDPTAGYSGTTFDASWTPPGHMTPSGYGVVLDDSPTTVPTAVTQSGPSFEITDLDPGTYFLHVRAHDDAGDWSGTSTFRFTVFALMTPTDGGLTNGNVELQVPAPAGAHDVTFEFRTDDANSWSTVPDDRLATGGASATQPVQPDGSSGVTDLYQWDAADTSASDSGVGDNALDTKDEPFAVRAEMTDDGGATITTAAVTVSLDRVAPSISLALPSSNTGVYLAGTDVAVTWSTEDSDVAGYSVVVDDTESTNPPDTVNTSPGTTSDDVTQSTTGVRYLHIKAVDNAGNWSDPETMPVIFADAVLTSPAEGATVDGSTSLDLGLIADQTAYACWEYKTDGMNDWSDVPAADVTDGGSAIAGWPISLTANSESDLDWADYPDASGIDDWPGEFHVRAVLVPNSDSACNDPSAQQVYAVHQFYQPSTSGSFRMGDGFRPDTVGVGPAAGLTPGPIFYAEETDSGSQNMTMNGDGTGSAPVDLEHPDGSLQGGASLDGTVIAHEGDPNTGSCTDSIVIRTPTGSTSHTVSGILSALSVSNDGAWIAYMVDDCSGGNTAQTIFVSSTSSWDPMTEETSDGDFSLGAVGFTPDDADIMWDEIDNHPDTCGITGGCSTIQVAPFSPDPPSGLPAGTLYTGTLCWSACNDAPSAVWSPDGSALAVNQGGRQLLVFNSDIATLMAEGGNPTPDIIWHPTDIPAISDDFFVLGPWASDDANLLVATPEADMYDVNAQTGDDHELLRNADPSVIGVLPYAWTSLPSDQNILASIYRPYLYFDSSEHWLPLSPDDLLEQSDNAACTWYQSTYDLNATAYPSIYTDCQPLSPNSPSGVQAVLDNDASDATTDASGGTPIESTSSPTRWANTQLAIDGEGQDAASQSSETKASSYHGPAADDTCDPLCDATTDPFYYHVVDGDDGYTYIQYWIFYRFNDATAVPLDEVCGPVDACDEHQGDWEGVTVALTDNPVGEVAWVAYSQHTHWYKYSADDIRAHSDPSVGDAGLTDGTHAKTYVASGTHANYPDNCSSDCANWDIAADHAFGFPVPATESDHDGGLTTGGGDPIYANDDDSVCADACVLNLADVDFMQDNWTFTWGIDPCIPPDVQECGSSNGGLAAAPGSPDYPEPGHGGSDSGNDYYDHPGATAVSGTGHWQENANNDWRPIMNGLPYLPFP